MPLFSSKLQLTNAASSSGTALADIQFVRGAFHSIESSSHLVNIPVDRIADNQIVWVDDVSATYKATFIVADYISIFADSASWAPFTGFGSGGGGGGDISALNTFTSSIQGQVDALITATSSYTTGSHASLVALNAFTSSILTFTSSIQTEVDSLTAVTGSYATTGSNTFIGDQSIDGLIILTTQSSEPSYISGGLYLDNNYNLFVGGS